MKGIHGDILLIKKIEIIISHTYRINDLTT